jgi:hypothetical protein
MARHRPRGFGGTDGGASTKVHHAGDDGHGAERWCTVDAYNTFI